ncbi:hypothetical protein BT69DRAFT_1338226 [Atractiella rhizophila]|nr:hypothetical protein BT69DRAFT_1338226 [Atractiella rhizophila]
MELAARLNPVLRPLRWGSETATHTIELYLDYVCPFSAKILIGIERDVFPLFTNNPSLKEEVSFVFRPQVQPWHAQSTLVHETGLAVAKLSSESKGIRSEEAKEVFWKYSLAFMKIQEQFFDEHVAAKTLIQVREELAKFAEETVGISSSDILKLTTTGKGNSANPITTEFKYAVKISRQNGIHVSPTVLLDGIIEPSISSSFTKEQWKQYLEEKTGLKLQ